MTYIDASNAMIDAMHAAADEADRVRREAEANRPICFCCDFDLAVGGINDDGEDTFWCEQHTCECFLLEVTRKQADDLYYWRQRLEKQVARGVA